MNASKALVLIALLGLLAPLVLSGCVSSEAAGTGSPDSGRFLGSFGGWLSGEATAPQATTLDGERAARAPRQGYAELAEPSRPAATAASGEVAVDDDGRTFSINFVDTGLQDFVRIVFEEILHETVVVDPALTARVTVRTAAPVSKAAALDVVKGVLANAGASLRQVDGIYRIAAGGVGPGGADRQALRVVPLRFIDAEQARNALQPFGSDPVRLTALPGGKVLVMAGAPAELDRFEQVLATLDIDQLQDRSFALAPLETAGAAAVAQELNTMFDSGDGRAFRAVPIERMNAVLLLGRSNATIRRAHDWIGRLDQAGEDERRVHVYPVQNRRAAELASILQGIVGGGEGASTTVAPDAEPAVATIEASSGGATVAAAVPARADSTAPSGVAISADPATNSLVIVATPEDYRTIERAIRRLDIMPTQVLIEATIAEVSLNDTLRHGVRWYLETGHHGVMLSDDSGRNVGSVLPGFNYIFSAAGSRVVIDALEEETKVDIISSPALTVLDNQTATLKVGDQVPIATRSARSVLDPDAPVVNDIEMKDTGILLTVKPRVNANGLVQLDISQEISDVVATTTSSIDSPTIRQRAVTSSVVVKSGTEIVLGGMISSRRERGRSGLPILKDIPLVGEAFTSLATRDKGRTELLILIRPVVLAHSVDVQAVTAEIRARILDEPMVKP